MRGEGEALLRMRRVRNSDDGADAMSIQAKRCLVQVKSHSWRTAATMTGSAVVVIVAGVFAWGSAEHFEMRATTALVTHAHADTALSRELETLRHELLRRLAIIDHKLDGISKSRVRRPAVGSGNPMP